MIGKSIIALRECRGLNQLDLAKRIGMSGVQLCNIERGRVIPRQRTLERIAVGLGVTVGELVAFENDAENSVRLVPIRRAVAALDEPRAAVERANVRFENLARKRGIPLATTLPFHHAYLLQEHSSEILADAMRDALRIGRAAIPDLVWALEFANVRVCLLPLPENVQSAAWWNPGRDSLTIVVDEASTPERQTYRLAYELGAACLFLSSGSRPVRETMREHRFLSEFAADFLMPAVTVADMVVKCGIAPDGWSYGQLLAFKGHFGVSAETFARRLEELGLIAKPLRLKFRDRLRAHYRQHPKAMEPEPCRGLLKTGGRERVIQTSGKEAAND